MYFPPPARYSAPLLVLVFGLMTTWLNYRWHLADELARGVADLRGQSDATGARLARLGGQLATAGGIAALKADLAATATAPNLALAAFVDRNGWVLAGSSSDLSGRESRQTLLRAAANLMRSSPESSVLYSEDAAQLYAAYPVVNSTSWVLLVYDRSATMIKARQDALHTLEWSAFATGMSCLALWAVLHFGFARRIARLAEEVGSFGSGARRQVAPMSGGDEVAELSRAFARMVEQVSAHEAERSSMERQVLDAGEKERRRIGHELHDGLGQRLTAAALAADALAADAQESETGARAQEIARQLRTAIRETRQLSHGLAPVGMEKGGLVNALAEIVETINQSNGLRGVFECDLASVSCSTEVATHLFRIAQEAVNNALKHAQASEIRLSLTLRGALLTLEVEDDGEGLPEPPPPENQGLGLRVMQHRAQMIGGALQIAPSTAGGTLVRCTVPLPS